MKTHSRSGFSLFELSIVLIILGLIVGVVLSGQDLINAARQRSQLSQLEKYSSAAHTFQTKYGQLPGDLQLTIATKQGFVTTSCTGAQGSRDGNDQIEGFAGGYPLNDDQFVGETVLFWEDLSQAGLIDGIFPGGNGAARSCSTADTTPLTLTKGAYFVGNFIPESKFGLGNYVYVYSASTYDGGGYGYYPLNADNWYGVSQVTGTWSGNGWTMMSNPTIPVIAAYNMDAKIDDGLPTTGNVIAFYSTGNGIFVSTTAASASSSTCFDTTNYKYSAGINGGNGGNCGISFRMQ